MTISGGGGSRDGFKPALSGDEGAGGTADLSLAVDPRQGYDGAFLDPCGSWLAIF